MNILVIGGTRYFGIHMVNKLLEQGYNITIATRGKTPDSYGDRVKRIIIERTNEESMRKVLQGKYFDVVMIRLHIARMISGMLWIMLIVINTYICLVHQFIIQNI